MFSRSIVFVATAIILLAATALGAFPVQLGNRHVRVLQTNESTGPFGVMRACVTTKGGESFRTEDMGFIVWIIYRLMGLFLGTQVHTLGLSCAELCPCSTDGVCSKITTFDYTCSCNTGFDFDGTSCVASRTQD